MANLNEQVKKDIKESKNPVTRRTATAEINVDGKYEGSFCAYGDNPDDYVSYNRTFDSMSEFSKYADAFLKL